MNSISDTSAASQPPGNSSAAASRSGALEKHPRFAEAAAEYEAWAAGLPAAERGGPGQRNWRVRCVAKACELLYAKTGRATGSAVLRIIGFGSSTDVSTDVREWIENAAPRRDAWLQIAPLMGSEALRESVEGALMQIFTGAQAEARRVAKSEFEAHRLELEAERQQARAEVDRALAAREAALATAAAYERERDQHAAARQKAESECARLQGKLDESMQSLAASAERELKLQGALQSLQAETTVAIAQLRDASERYSLEVSRLEGDRRRLLGDVEQARQERDHLRKDLATRVAEAERLTQRNAEHVAESARAASRAAVAEARALDLETQVRNLHGALAQGSQDLVAVQAQLARELAAKSAREHLTLGVQREAARRMAVRRVLQASGGVVIVDGDVLPRMEIQLAGEAITPRFDSIADLEAYCTEHSEVVIARARGTASP